jgi:hypothetical protein
MSTGVLPCERASVQNLLSAPFLDFPSQLSDAIFALFAVERRKCPAEGDSLDYVAKAEPVALPVFRCGHFSF